MVQAVFTHLYCLNMPKPPSFVIVLLVNGSYTKITWEVSKVSKLLGSQMNFWDPCEQWKQNLHVIFHETLIPGQDGQGSFKMFQHLAMACYTMLQSSNWLFFNVFNIFKHLQNL